MYVLYFLCLRLCLFTGCSSWSNASSSFLSFFFFFFGGDGVVGDVCLLLLVQMQFSYAEITFYVHFIFAEDLNIAQTVMAAFHISICTALSPSVLAVHFNHVLFSIG